ncbi:MAG: helix-turn-helix domain-containing protein [Anaerolineae bacterium]|nr:helix-turn-helix domain-containing protein [Anaerolineae bacterium]
MGRNIDRQRLAAVLQTIKENDGRLRMNDIARRLNLHPQAVARLLPAVGEKTGELLYEDERGFLGIFKK